MSSPSHHPHDRYFRSAFAIRQLMQEYLEEFMPREIAENLQLDQLEQQKDSYLDKNLEQYFSDVVYTVPYGSSQLKITLLLEHKSYLPPHPWLQLLQYLVNAYSAQRAQVEFTGQFFPVIPIVIYHGKSSWEIRPVYSYFEGVDPNLSRFIPEFAYHLTDLTQLTKDDLQQKDGNLVRNLFFALKLSSTTDEKERTRMIIEEMIRSGLMDQDLNFFELTFVYLTKLGTSKESIMATMEHVGDESREKILSVYDQLVQEGIMKEKFSTFKKGVAMNIDLSDLLALTGISKDTAAKWEKLLSENPDASFPA